MNKQPPGLRRMPRQGRSKMLVAAILEACQIILDDEGPEQLTTNKIAEVAGVNIGSLYQYFPNKDAILATLFSNTLASESKKIARQSSLQIVSKIDVSLEATIREIIHVEAALHIRFMSIHGDFYREYHDFVNFRQLVDNTIVSVFKQPSFDTWLPELFAQYKSEIIVEDIEQAAFIVSNIIRELLESAVDHDPSWLSQSSFLDNVERACMNFLCGTVETPN